MRKTLAATIVSISLVLSLLAPAGAVQAGSYKHGYYGHYGYGHYKGGYYKRGYYKRHHYKGYGYKHRHRHKHGGALVAAGIIGGAVLLGALLAAPRYYGPPRHSYYAPPRAPVCERDRVYRYLPDGSIQWGVRTRCY